MVEFHEFLEIMVEYRKEDDSKEALIKSFKYFDRDNMGVIDWLEFKHTISCVADKLSTNKINKLEGIASEFLDENKTKLNYVKFMAKIMI